MTPAINNATPTTITGIEGIEILKPQIYINWVIENAPIPARNQRVPFGIRKTSPSREKTNPSKKGNLVGVIGTLSTRYRIKPRRTKGLVM